jgi:hypothetical protein
LISKIQNKYLFKKKKRKENVRFFRKENKNFIEYMKVFDNNNGEFDSDKVANLIIRKWGKKVLSKNTGYKKN